MIPSSMLVKNIVYEKEMRLKEMMRIMGLGDAVHWLAWAAQSFTLNLVSIIVISVLLKYGQIMPDTDLTLLMVFFTLFAIASITQCVFFSTLFSRANIATASSAILFYVLFFPYQISARTGSYTFTLITVSGFTFLL
ncbi:unnamed protein product [Anisakis simplex]|uniref:ABC transporter permease n=1 Tax=Anisakis simplex TaxID=6269 RepID=A0A0M3KK33_ANISI|nr:unnamed protein product [Anisakis simplex]